VRFNDVKDGRKRASSSIMREVAVFKLENEALLLGLIDPLSVGIWKNQIKWISSMARNIDTRTVLPQ